MNAETKARLFPIVLSAVAVLVSVGIAVTAAQISIELRFLETAIRTGVMAPAGDRIDPRS